MNIAATKMIRHITVEAVLRFDTVLFIQILFVGATSLGRGYSPLEFCLKIFAHSNENTAREISNVPRNAAKNTALLLDERT